MSRLIDRLKPYDSVTMPNGISGHSFDNQIYLYARGKRTLTEIQTALNITDTQEIADLNSLLAKIDAEPTLVEKDGCALELSAERQSYEDGTIDKTTAKTRLGL